MWHQGRSTDIRLRTHSDLWFRLYDDFLDTVIFPVLDDLDESILKGRGPSKIAVLDTGIDTGHPVIRANAERIIQQKDWVADGNGAQDIYGHGTHTAALLLQLAPSAHIYVARIATDKYMASEDHVVQVGRRVPWTERHDLTENRQLSGQPHAKST